LRTGTITVSLAARHAIPIVDSLVPRQRLIERLFKSHVGLIEFLDG